MIKSYKNTKRLIDALVTNASLNQINHFRSNFESIRFTPSKIKGTDVFLSPSSNNIVNELMNFAIMNLSKDVCEYLLDKEFKCNYVYCLTNCKFDKVKDVWILIEELEKKYGKFNTSLHSDTTTYQWTNSDVKRYIISRIIEPQKVSDNKDRLNYVIDLIRTGFLDSSEVISIADELYKSDKWKGKFKMVTREIILSELGI